MVGKVSNMGMTPTGGMRDGFVVMGQLCILTAEVVTQIFTREKTRELLRPWPLPVFTLSSSYTNGTTRGTRVTGTLDGFVLSWQLLVNQNKTLKKKNNLLTFISVNKH